jgi:hypothetical protein
MPSCEAADRSLAEVGGPLPAAEVGAVHAASARLASERDGSAAAVSA